MRLTLFALSMVLMGASGWVSAAATEQDCALQSCLSGPPVKDDADGLWSTGLMVGVLVNTYQAYGPFHTSTELEFLVDDGLPEELARRYAATPYHLSISQDKQALAVLLDSFAEDVAMVIRYRYPLVQDLRQGYSKYLVTGFDDTAFNFASLESYQQYPSGIIDQASYDNEGFFNRNGRAVGVIGHVSRWGMKGRRHCTLYLNKGGTSVEKRDQYYSERRERAEDDPDANDEESGSAKSYHTRALLEPFANVMKLDTTNEQVCQYAEHAALSRERVRVRYSGSETSNPLAPTGVIVHSIEVLL